MKGNNMNKTLEKDYETMKDKVDKLLGQIDKLVCDFDEKYDVNVANDLHYKLDEVADLIEDNNINTDFDE
jgi:hypothetical protein